MREIAHYRIESKLGAGGMGEVFLAQDTKLGRRVALKLLTSAPDGNARKLLLREAQTASALNHPNICVVYEVGDDYIAMEYVEGRTLAALAKDGALPASDVVRYGLQIADALAHAHDRGFLHRDLKCANVIVTPEGRVKLLDFGLAMRTPEAAMEEITRSRQTADGSAMAGTIQYMAPELLRSEPPAVSADIWALGVVLYNLSAGRLPFQGKTVYELSSAILSATPPPLPDDAPTNLRMVIARCLEKDPARRYARASEVRAVLEVPGAGPAGVIATPKAAASSRGRAAAIFVGLAVCAAAASLLFLRRPVPAPQQTVQELLIGASFHSLRMNKDDNAAAIALYEQAIARDPNNAQAYGSLADAYLSRGFAFVPAERDALEQKAYVAIQKALQLDPKSANAHIALANYLWSPQRNFAIADAIQECRRAVASAPASAKAYDILGHIEVHSGLLPEAIAAAARGRALDPTDTNALLTLSEAQVGLREYQNALTTLEGVPNGFDIVATQRVAWCRFKLGNKTEATKLIDDTLANPKTDDGSGMVISTRAVLRADAGDAAGAQQAIDATLAREKAFRQLHHQTAYNLACTYAILKRPTEAVAALRTSVANGLISYPLLSTESCFAGLQNDPGFVALMVEVQKKHDAPQAMVDAPLPESR